MDAASHPNGFRVQETWDALARGEIAGLDDQAENIVVENGPGAGPWRLVEGREAFVDFVLEFIPLFEGTWHQDGRCVYADDRCTISLVHETGIGPNGDQFDNMAVWISRIGPDGKNDRLWTVDLDQEHVTSFWSRNKAAVEGPRSE
jgi:ketosteroid isomerase-like protein